ncbi:acetyl-CoA carboxylase biotin carboxyl carrier protein subunit [Zobellella denitrificans]|uniref:acetyl-CoA carboxylase biotin carboxyl carrier protein subunit n=1 Tax=Zobellella denitrificans TaxID=347534 RepID=UPI0020CF34B5|nr:acetyl-CoA carboxylase biotin carboxyl carrier protein subunit [Zobellella denitrificans]
MWLFHRGERHDLRLAPLEVARHQAGHQAGLRAPMPGIIGQLRVAVGDTVVAGQTLLVLEAMKMEHPLRAPAAGRVADIFCREGDQVSEGDELLRLEGADG